MPLCQATHGLLTMPWHLISLLIYCSVKVEAFFGNEQAQEDGIKGMYIYFSLSDVISDSIPFGFMWALIDFF